VSSVVNYASWLLPRVLEPTYTSWDLQPFAEDCGYSGPPFRWDPERRFLLRCELDAAFFDLYGSSRDDAAYILDTFPIVRRKEEERFGEYRTKRVMLEIYDALADAARTGQPYQTRLNPPPADPRVAHSMTPDTGSRERPATPGVVGEKRKAVDLDLMVSVFAAVRDGMCAAYVIAGREANRRFLECVRELGCSADAASIN
jgi:hypothetical protein